MLNENFYEKLIYVCLCVFTISVNKYVLSNLHFTLPTVFQGWQTLVCVTLLSTIIRWTSFRLETEKFNRKTGMSLLVPVVLFSLGNVAGSKALADLPVAVFLAGSNIVPAGLSLLEAQDWSSTYFKSAGNGVICGTLFLLYLLQVDRGPGWFWLCVYITSYIIYMRKIASLALHSAAVVYYCNFGSVIVLLPLSIYLQEAHSALNHARHAQIEFYVGCILSGVLGTGVQLLTARLQGRPNTSFFYGIAKILSCTMSLLCFPNDLGPLSWLIIQANLVISCFWFIPDENVDISKRAQVAIV